MLELNKLTGPVAEMAKTLAGQQASQSDLVQKAREKLAQHAQVTQALQDKLKLATTADASWRGADPLGGRLDEQRQLPDAAAPATLIASDGSQIYPDTHGVALYYLINVGAIVLRQGSGQAPQAHTQSEVFYDQEDLYTEDRQGLVNVDEVNFQRDLRELRTLARTAWQERRRYLGGDAGRMLVALADGPLLPWVPQRLTDAEQRRRVDEYAKELDALRSEQVQAVPVGYVDRPRSANLLRLLHLADLPEDQINKQALRASPYHRLADRSLFHDLAPGQRTGLFAATSEINRTYEKRGHRICFAYLNVAKRGEREAHIVRVETPEWAAQDQERLDAALAAIWADCRLTGYPYVLTRADELARVSRAERDVFEQMLRVEMMRQGLAVAESTKQRYKGYTGL